MAAPALSSLCAAFALSLSLVAGCTSDGPRPQGPRAVPSAPARGHVYEAVVRLGDTLHTLYRTWPAHLARSADLPELPLVEVREVENRGEIEGVELETLGWELNQQLRTQGRLRVLSDESSLVPATGENAPPELGAGPRHAGLVLYPWVDAAGRFCLMLEDAVKDERVAVARSNTPEPARLETR
ncbi:MAG: hypothetical protein KDD82_24290 [Planctomycetes bacterium]|nr:hypothetical protein [Planctomycetota bacterium]